jgi:flagellar hook capping protein FlgD
MTIRDKYILSILFFTILIYLNQSTSIAQQVAYNQEFQLNADTCFSYFNHCICALSDSNFVVCWEGYDRNQNVNAIYGQIFNRFGIKINKKLSIVDSSGDQRYPDICGLPGGGFVICWESAHSGGPFDILCQIYDNSGNKIGAEIQVNSNFRHAESFPNISNLSNGGFVICWQSYDDINSWEVYGQIFDENGIKQGTEFHINTYTIHYQFHPHVYGLCDGRFVTCWTSGHQDGSSYGVFGRIFSNNGTPLSNEFQVNTTVENSQKDASVTGILDSGFVVSWTSNDNASISTDVYSQIYNNNGTRYGGEFRINEYTYDLQHFSDLCELSSGGIIACWESMDQDGSGFGVFGQLLDSFGNRIGKEFKINDYTISNQYQVKVCSLADGGIVVCWLSWGQDCINYDIYGKYYMPSPILHNFASYSLLNPLDDTTQFSIPVDFKWQESSSIHRNFPWEQYYKLFLDTIPEFINPQIYSNIYDSTYSVYEVIPGQTYYWKVLAFNINEDSLWSSETFSFFLHPNATQINQNQDTYNEIFQLYNNYPNPFNHSSNISYYLPNVEQSYNVTLKIYNIVGELVVTIINEKQSNGFHGVNWNGKNLLGQSVPSGIYIYTLVANEFTLSKKMVLLK